MSKKRTSISLTQEAIRKAGERYKALGYDSFSEYLEFLILQDAQERRQHTTVRSEAGQSYEAEPKPEDNDLDRVRSLSQSVRPNPNLVSEKGGQKRPNRKERPSGNQSGANKTR